jgi:hypothetical protein
LHIFEPCCHFLYMKKFFYKREIMKSVWVVYSLGKLGGFIYGARRATHKGGIYPPTADSRTNDYDAVDDSNLRMSLST